MCWGRDPGVVLAGAAVPGFVLAVALLVVLALGSPEVLLLVLAAGVSLAWSGWGSAWPCVSSTGCCGISSAGLAALVGLLSRGRCRLIYRIGFQCFHWLQRCRGDPIRLHLPSSGSGPSLQGGADLNLTGWSTGLEAFWRQRGLSGERQEDNIRYS